MILEEIFQKHQENVENYYHPRMQHGNAFGCICLSICLSACPVHALILKALT